MDSTSERDTLANSQSLEQTVSQNSQTAADYIDQQLALEADAKEILPYKFDQCTYLLGPLRQSVFACLTCSPPPASTAQIYTPAGICYACSISCHGEHNLVELFNRRNFVCDCGTTRMPSTSLCALRSNLETGNKGVASQEPAKGNIYNQNFQNRFCGCGEEYDADTEKGTMYQCMGLGSVETGGCGEDWWHPQCLMGLPKDWAEQGMAASRTRKEHEDEEADENEHPAPKGFPHEDDFATLICYKCVESNPWIKPYAGTSGFLPPLFKKDLSQQQKQSIMPSLKRKASDDDKEDHRPSSPTKRLKEEETVLLQRSTIPSESATATLEAKDATLPGTPDDAPASNADMPSTTLEARYKHNALPEAPQGTFSLLTKEDFREHLCHCPQCFPNLIPHPQLQEEEEEYQPSISDSVQSLAGGNGGAGSATRSHGTGSILDRGEAALSTMDRVKAIEGVMVYNHLRDKVKEFLKPYAESGKPVGAEDIKAYFEKLRGDHDAVKEASEKPVPDDANGGDNRREQGGY